MHAHIANGTFEIVMKPLAGADAEVTSMSLHKVFSGDLSGSSAGQMLAVRTAQEGSAGYVAMERVTGTLSGRQGTFALQHSGTMERGAASARIGVIPDSGTGGLAGLTGSMEISVQAGQHHYVFRYDLPE